jgi:alcohol dehydrogenase class IV
MKKLDIEYYNPVRVCFSLNEDVELPAKISITKTFLIVSETASNLHPDILKRLSNNAIIYRSQGSNPDICDIDTIDVPLDCSQIIGIGGGSVLDTAKACFAKLLTGGRYSLSELIQNPGILENYRTKRSHLNLILVPTTFGTSSELTKWGTIWDWRNYKKYSINHEFLYADIALIIPGLSHSVPRDITASTALDVISHALESIWNRKSNYVTRIYAIEAIKIVLEILPKLIKDLDSREYRVKQAKASVWAGWAFSQTQTASAHALSYPLTLFHKIPHGYACSITLGAMFEYNFHKAKTELEEVLCIFQKRYGTTTSTFNDCFLRFLQDCNIPYNLRDYGVTSADISRLVSNAFHPDRFSNMVHVLSEKEVEEIYEAVF